MASNIANVKVEISVVLGRSVIPDAPAAAHGPRRRDRAGFPPGRPGYSSWPTTGRSRRAKSSSMATRSAFRSPICCEAISNNTSYLCYLIYSPPDSCILDHRAYLSCEPARRSAQRHRCFPSSSTLETVSVGLAGAGEGLRAPGGVCWPRRASKRVSLADDASTRSLRRLQRALRRRSGRARRG